MNAVIPIGDLGRPAEHGRIRFGIKGDRGQPKVIDTWRFTSTDESAIRVLADVYGGTPEKWEDKRANPPEQWEVITEANEIEVFLPVGGLSQSYEIWSAGGCERRCDGETMEIPDANEGWVSAPCQCFAKGVLECKPKTRLSVYLPQVDFAGSWRLESSGKNVLHEFAGMFDALAGIQAMYGDGQQSSLVKCYLTLTQQKRVHGGKTRRYTVPKFRLADSITGIAEGRAAAGLTVGSGSDKALPAAPRAGIRRLLVRAPVPEDDIIDADIIDAEIAAEDDTQPRTWTKAQLPPPEGVKVHKTRGKDEYVEIL